MSMRNDVSDHIDLPPEYCQYADLGCEFAPACLNCHLPVCVYDEPGGKQALNIRRRKAEMVRLHTREGKSVKELAVIFGVCTRTVQRALQGCSEKPAGSRGHQTEETENERCV